MAEAAAAAATTTAATTTAATTTAATTTAAAPPAWDWNTAGLPAEDLAHVTTKGYKSVADVVTAHRNVEKLIGVPGENLIKLPGSLDDAAAMRPILERLGAGKTVDDYKLPVPEGQDGAFAKTAAGWMHELGVPTKTAAALADKWNAAAAESMKATQTKAAETHAADLVTLRGEWGKEYDGNLALVDKAATAFGLGKPEVEALQKAMGTGKALKVLHNIGSRLGVDDTNVPNPGNRPTNFGALTPEAARAKIATLKADTTWTAKYLSGDTEAKAEFERLHRISVG